MIADMKGLGGEPSEIALHCAGKRQADKRIIRLSSVGEVFQANRLSISPSRAAIVIPSWHVYGTEKVSSITIPKKVGIPAELCRQRI